MSNLGVRWAQVGYALIDELPPVALASLRIVAYGGAENVRDWFARADGQSRFTGSDGAANLRQLLTILGPWRDVPAVVRLAELVASLGGAASTHVPTIASAPTRRAGKFEVTAEDEQPVTMRKYLVVASDHATERCGIHSITDKDLTEDRAINVYLVRAAASEEFRGAELGVFQRCTQNMADEELVTVVKNAIIISEGATHASQSRKDDVTVRMVDSGKFPVCEPIKVGGRTVMTCEGSYLPMFVLVQKSKRGEDDSRVLIQDKPLSNYYDYVRWGDLLATHPANSGYVFGVYVRIARTPPPIVRTTRAGKVDFD